MKLQIELFIPNHCYIGITPYSDKNQETGFFIRLADTIEAYGFYGKQDEIVRIKQLFPFEKQSNLEEKDYMERLERAIQKMSKEEMDHLLTQLLNEIEQAGSYPVAYVKRLMIEILSRFSDKAAQLGGSIDELEVADGHRHYQKLVNTTNLQAMRD